MGIKTDGYNVDAGVSAGFVKTDGSGDFLFGEPGGGGGGVGTGWQLIEVKDITVDATTVTFSGLDGDADGEYMLLFRFRTSQALEVFYTIEPNGISANQNTIRQIIIATGVSTSTFPTLLLASAGTNTDKQWIGIVYFDAKTGTTVRQIISESSTRLTNLTIAAGGLRRSTFAGSWDDTTTNITSLDIVSDIANGIGSGSQLCLYKKTPENAGGGLQLIETKLITTDTSGLTFSGLNGDVDKCYKLIWSTTAPSSGPIPQYFIIQPNGQVANTAGSFHDTLFVNENSLGAVRFQFPELRFATIGLSPRVNGGELTFFAETGRQRTYMSMLNTSDEVPPSPFTRTGNQHWHGSWSDGASNTINITSLVLTERTGNPVAFTAGSRFSLYRVIS